jgi:hypothetical protein
MFGAVISLAALCASPSADAASCPADMDFRAAPDKTDLGKEGTMGDEKSWLDKYVVKTHSEEWLLCYGVRASVTPGCWPIGGDVFNAWVEAGQDASLCCTFMREIKTSTYCDEAASGMLACDGPLPNATFFSVMGEVGQDCPSWGLLASLTAGEISASTVAEVCSARCASLKCRMSFARFHDLSDATPYTRPGWMDKYATGEHTGFVIRCDSLNTANLVGDWPEESPFLEVWRNAHKESDVRRACSRQEVVYGEYSYCDETRNDTIICDEIDTLGEYLKDYGKVGQDCRSWQMLAAFLAGEVTEDDIAETCMGDRSLGRARSY